MSKLREAAQAVIDMYYHRSWGTTSYIPSSVEALRDALAEDESVEFLQAHNAALIARIEAEEALEVAVRTEREACARIAEARWLDILALLEAQHRSSSLGFNHTSYDFDIQSALMSKSIADLIRARENNDITE